MSSGNGRVTTRELHDTMTEGFHSIDKRLSKLERDVQGSNGEGLWDILKTMRKEYREGADRHREEHRRLWERLTDIEERGIERDAKNEGADMAVDDKRAERERKRRRVEVWVWPAAAALIGAMQVVNIVLEWGG